MSFENFDGIKLHCRFDFMILVKVMFNLGSDSGLVFTVPVLYSGKHGGLYTLNLNDDDYIFWIKQEI